MWKSREMDIQGIRRTRLQITERWKGMEEVKEYKSIEEWKNEGVRRFGKDVKKWKFKCPMCGHIASVQDFIDAGADDAANVAYVECLGRYTGKGSPQKGDDSGCNWAAYGLFGIPNGGIYVSSDNKYIHIFDFAEGDEKDVHGL